MKVLCNINLELAGTSDGGSGHLISEWIVFLWCDRWT